MNSIGLTGTSINSLQKEYEVIANNLANVNTSGFKRTVTDFTRKLEDDFAPEGDALKGSEIESECAIDFSQGSLVNTGRNLDVAICGPGFFVIETENGPLYNRNSSLQVNSMGRMVNSDGHLVAGEYGPILVPKGISSEDLVFSSDGSVRADGRIIGKLKIVDFDGQENRLRPVGKGNFIAPDDMYPQIAKKAVLKQGYQEGSNVNMVEELVAMINVTRMYEANMKILTKKSEDNGSILSVAMG